MANLAEARATRARDQIEIHLDASIGLIGFSLIMVTLVLADFVANSPLFGELLPKPGGADVVLHKLLQNSGSAFSFGMRELGGRMAVHPEAAFFAFAVVVFLLILCDWFGRELRLVLAPTTKERRINQFLGRSVWPLSLSFTGIVSVLIVLFVARGTIETGAKQRRDERAQEATTAFTAYQEAKSTGTADEIDRKAAASDNAQAALDEARERFDYAKTVGAANLPILALNAALALTAILAGFYRRKGQVVLDPSPLPLVTPGVEIIEKAKSEFETAWQMAFQDLRRAEAGVERAQHLLASKPFRNSEEIAEALRGVVPLFRTENARLRKLHPTDIKAFHKEPPSYLHLIDAESAYEIPARLGECEVEIAQLSVALNRVGHMELNAPVP
jgi:hypothetical protein